MSNHLYSFAFQRSLLATQSIVRALQSEYAIEPKRCRLIKSLLCDTYDLETTTTRYIFRVYPFSSRTIVEINAELVFILHLSTSELSVSTPIARRNGKYLLSIAAPEGERQGVLFTYADGTPLHRIDEMAHTRAFGILSARLHLAADKLTHDLNLPKFDSDLLLDKPLAQLEQVYGHRTDVLAYLHDVAVNIKFRIESSSMEMPRFGLCHGDLNRSNVHLSTQGQLTLFDFEYCNYGWRAYDLATLINTESDEYAQAFLDGYESIRKLDVDERRTIPVFQVAQKIWMLGTGASHVDTIGFGWMTDRFLDSQLDIIKTAYARVMG